jgi:hypothetical protein
MATRSGVHVRVCILFVSPDGDASKLDVGEIPIRVLVARHAPAACERMRVTRPAVVFVSEAMHRQELGMIFNAAEEIGAEVIRLPERLDHDEIREWLRARFGVTGAAAR